MMIFFDNLIEVLLSVVLIVNIGAWKFLYNEMKNVKEETEKNSQTTTMMLNRIFGVDVDSTNDGHIEETEVRFKQLDAKLDSISEEIKKNEEERKKEHKEVYQVMSDIVISLSAKEEIDFEKEFLD